MVATEQTVDSSKVSVLRVANAKDVPRVLQDKSNDKYFHQGDWFIVIDANEVISFPQSSSLNLTLKETLVRIGHEPYRFNAVALSVFFMQSKDGQAPEPEYPFRIYGQDAWNVGAGANDELWPVVDTLKNRVHIWQKQEDEVTLVTNETVGGVHLITDVVFTGRNVYPYHAQSLRFHPKSRSPYTWLGTELRRMYVLDTALGYTHELRKQILVHRYLY